MRTPEFTASLGLQKSASSYTGVVREAAASNMVSLQAFARPDPECVKACSVSTGLLIGTCTRLSHPALVAGCIAAAAAKHAICERNCYNILEGIAAPEF